MSGAGHPVVPIRAHPAVWQGQGQRTSREPKIRLSPPAHRGALRAAHARRALPEGIRRHRRRRWPCRHRGRAGRRADGLRDAAADAQHRDAGADELQPVDRRHRQGAPRQGSRRARRRDGAGHRRGRDPVSHPQREQGPGGARDARAGRPRAVQGGDPPPHREPARAVGLPAGGRRPDPRRRAGGRCGDPGRRALCRARAGADRRHLPRRAHSRRPAEPPRRARR